MTTSLWKSDAWERERENLNKTPYEARHKRNLKQKKRFINCLGWVGWVRVLSVYWIGYGRVDSGGGVLAEDSASVEGTVELVGLLLSDLLSDYKSLRSLSSTLFLFFLFLLSIFLFLQASSLCWACRTRFTSSVCSWNHSPWLFPRRSSHPETHGILLFRFLFVLLLFSLFFCFMIFNGSENKDAGGLSVNSSRV